MRLVHLSMLCLCVSMLVGCGGDSGPQTVDSSEVESYVAENADAVALQEQIDAAAEAEAAAEEEDE